MANKHRGDLGRTLLTTVAVALPSAFGLGFVAAAPHGPVHEFGAATDWVPVTTAAVRSAADTTITLYSYGTTLAFDPDFFTVKAGTTVRVRYVNEATLAHNFVVVREEDDIDVLGVAAFGASETGYVPLEHKDRMIAYSELAQPGTTVEVTFTAPPPGDYFFVCLVDGHFNIMVGTLHAIE